jgi:hypothetical protein
VHGEYFDSIGSAGKSLFRQYFSQFIDSDEQIN